MNEVLYDLSIVRPTACSTPSDEVIDDVQLMQDEQPLGDVYMLQLAPTTTWRCQTRARRGEGDGLSG